MADEGLLLYVGTYTGRGSEGIYGFRMDLTTGALLPVADPAPMENPSFLAADPGGRYLYAVAETHPEGCVAAFRVAPETGELAPINRRSSHGSSPCHLCVDGTGRFVVVANYGSGSVALLPVGEGGELEEACCVVQHEGSGADPGRQEGPHAHSVTLSPDNLRVFAADLGCDKVFIYRLDAAKGKLAPNDPAFAALKPGAGPRHFDFHPNGRFAYTINELDSTVTAFAYDAGRGSLSPIQLIGTLPEGFQGNNSTADVHVHPSGKFLYGSNRGHNSIAIFAVDSDTGKLRALGHESTQGKTPRNFGLDPSGTLLLAANQDSGNVVVFRIDPKTGLLKATGSSLSVGAPVCVKFLEPLK